VLVWLQGVAAGCLWQCGRWALMEITFMLQQEMRALGCHKNTFFAIWGWFMLAEFLLDIMW